jgi:hypothetical protein
VPAGAKSSGVSISAAAAPLYQTGASMGAGSTRVFTISGTISGETYDLRAYVGDSSYNHSTTVTIGGATMLGTSSLTANTNVASPANMYNDTGILFAGSNAFVANGTSITVTLSSTAGGWAIDGLDFALDASSGGTGLPGVAQQAPADGPNTSAAAVPSLTQSELAPVVNEAIALWSATGLTPAQVSLLKNEQYVIQDLSKQGDLGLTGAAAVYLDPTALGYGWYIDASAGNAAFTPSTYGQLTAVAGSPAAGKMDLLTVVMHEMGHVLGLPDYSAITAPGDLMDQTLDVGTRRMPSTADMDAALAAMLNYQ